MIGSMSAFMLTLSCLNEEEWQAAAPALGMNPGDRERLQCVLEELGGPRGMAALLGSQDENILMELTAVQAECQPGTETQEAPGG